MLVHDTRRSGSPDIFIDPRHARHRLEIQSRHYPPKESLVGCDTNEDHRTIHTPSLRHPIQKNHNQPREHKTIANVPLWNENRKNSHSQPLENFHDLITPPISSEGSNFEENLKEIIIDLDDEVEEDERTTDQNGGNSPSYEPNSAIKVSEEDQQVFFGKRLKSTKIKTEARKQQDRQYVNQVRLLKEKAEELRKLSSKSSKAVNQPTSTRRNDQMLSDKNQIRHLKEQSVEIRRKIFQSSRIENQAAPFFYEHTSLTNHGGNNGACERNFYVPSTNFGSSSTGSFPGLENQRNISITSSFIPNDQETCSPSQLPHHQEPPKSSFFDHLILNACSNVQKKAEREMQKKKEINQRLLQSSSIISGDDLAKRVDSFVDKYVGSNSSKSVITTALANHESSNVIPRNNTDSICRDNSSTSYRPGTPPNQAETPPYEPSTPPRLEELENLKATRNIEVVCLSSDDECEDEEVRPRISSSTHGVIVEIEGRQNSSRGKPTNRNVNYIDNVHDDDVMIIDLDKECNTKRTTGNHRSFEEELSSVDRNVLSRRDSRIQKSPTDAENISQSKRRRRFSYNSSTNNM